jgi:hypothetical protein
LVLGLGQCEGVGLDYGLHLYLHCVCVYLFGYMVFYMKDETGQDDVHHIFDCTYIYILPYVSALVDGALIGLSVVMQNILKDKTRQEKTDETRQDNTTQHKTR